MLAVGDQAPDSPYSTKTVNPFHCRILKEKSPRLVCEGQHTGLPLKL